MCYYRLSSKNSGKIGTNVHMAAPSEHVVPCLVRRLQNLRAPNAVGIPRKKTWEKTASRGKKTQGKTTSRGKNNREKPNSRRYYLKNVQYVNTKRKKFYTI